jgi:hypothetical protein
MKISFKWHLVFYLAIVIFIGVEYQRWLNPLGLKPEVSPKQHDGSQEFQGLREWESVIQPAPDEEGVRRYPQPQKKVDTEIER